MQGDSLIFEPAPYNECMTAGRPAKFERSDFGKRLFTVRQQMGLSQTELAERLGITQSTYAGWERRTTAIKPGYIAKIANVFRIHWLPIIEYVCSRDYTTN